MAQGEQEMTVTVNLEITLISGVDATQAASP
jgi:hypothetical protein